MQIIKVCGSHSTASRLDTIALCIYQYSYTNPYQTYKKTMIHLIVGNTGSGKTIYANELKTKTDGVLFSIDKWNNTLFLPDKKSTDGLE
jgi:hypothetical protein